MNPMNPTSTAPAPEGEATAARGKTRRIVIALLVLAALAAGAAAYWYHYAYGRVYTDDARFAGSLVDVSAEVPGTLMKLSVHEGEALRAGQILFQLDARAAEARVAQAEAALALAREGVPLARARLDKAQNGPRHERVLAAEASARRLRAQVRLARIGLRRATALVIEKAVTRAQVDRAQAAYASARAALAAAGYETKLLEAGTRPEDLAAAHISVTAAGARVALAETNLRQAKVALARTTISAPFAGEVVRDWLSPGAMVIPGRPVLTLFDPASLHVNANIEEKDLPDVAVGDLCTISVDAYPSLTLRGRVTHILQATNSQFSLVPAEGVSGTFIKVTQRLRLRIHVDDLPPGELLGPGLSVEVTIDSGTARADPKTAVAHEAAATPR